MSDEEFDAQLANWSDPRLDEWVKRETARWLKRQDEHAMELLLRACGADGETHPT